MVMDRRRLEAMRLRTYFDQIKMVKAMTNDQWIEQWIHSNLPWVPKQDWINQLEQWALAEAQAMIYNQRGAA